MGAIQGFNLTADIRFGSEQAHLDARWSGGAAFYANPLAITIPVESVSGKMAIFYGTTTDALVRLVSPATIEAVFEGGWSIAKSGKATWGRATLTMVRDALGKLTHISFVIVDAQKGIIKTSGGLCVATGTLVVK